MTWPEAFATAVGALCFFGCVALLIWKDFGDR
jgi:hypothetical protein